MKPINLILVYKPPLVTTKSLLDDVKCHLELCHNNETYVVGDFNVNLLKHDSKAKELTSFMDEYDQVQLIKKQRERRCLLVHLLTAFSQIDQNSTKILEMLLMI